MARMPDVTQLREELADAFKWGDEDRLRAVVAKLAAQPRQARLMLDEMLASADAGERRAAVFGLGELGGPASLRRLQQQMSLEETRGGYDGASVLEVIVQALGRLREVGARAALIRRLQRLATGNPGSTDVSEVAYSLWRMRHPELIPVVRSALEKLPGKEAWALRALLRLLESPPEALAGWAMDASVPPGLKADVMAILDEEVPDELLPVLPAFIFAANALGDAPLHHKGEAAHFCDRLFVTLHLHRERVLPALTEDARSGLRALARRCVAAVDQNCSSHAAWMLEHVGRPEDAALLEAHRLAEPSFAKVFDDIARTLRKLPTD